MSGETGREPMIVAGCRMPSFEAIDLAERTRRVEAEIANQRFLEALGRYFDNGGRG